MLETYTYEYIRVAGDERRKRALERYERLYRRSDVTDSRPAQVEIAFATGCPSVDQLTA